MKKVKMKTILTCEKCGFIFERPFIRGDYINKRETKGTTHQTHDDDFCGEDLIITAIYRKNRRYKEKDLALLRKWQTENQKW